MSARTLASRFSKSGLGIVALAVGLAACSGRPRSSSHSNEPSENEPRILEFDLSAGVPEGAQGGLFQMPAKRTYTGLVRALERGLESKLTAGVFLHFANQGIDFSRSEELAELLGRYRKRNVPVVCHAHDLSNATSWLVLTGCNKVFMSAAGSMETVGMAAELVHLKGLLDRLKIEVDFLSIGKYKSGAEPLLREEPSEQAKEALSSTLGSMREAWLAGVEAGRSGSAQKLERGPYSPEEAKGLGLVDAVGYESDARAEIKRLAKTDRFGHVFGPTRSQDSKGGVAELIRLLTSGGDDARGKPHVAVVPAEGAITMDSSGPLESSGITSRALGKTLRRLREDSSVKAVVLRIDSPGGSPLASDLIWHELMELRKVKPIIASVGGMAASGGYYIASGAHSIVADRTSIVGSIGVFGGKIVVGPALREIGINSVAVPASPDPGAAARAAYLSPFSRWDDPTRERVRAHMQSIYDLFVARVAEARKMSVEAVRASAEGRIWSGTQGKERGLVDELGGLTRAIEVARQRAGLPGDVPVTIEGSREGLLEALLIGDDASEAEVRAALTRYELDHHWLREVPEEFTASVSALSPLLQGETSVLTLPFAVRVR